MMKSSKQAQQQAQTPQIEKNVLFSNSKSIVWQIRCVLHSINNKKTLTGASNELINLAEIFGSDFDRYLLRELIDQIDLKDPNKASKDKSEPFKVQLLNSELARSSQKPEFLLYFSEIATQYHGDRYIEFLNELSRRLKLNQTMQLLIALAIADQSSEDTWPDACKLLVQKLQDYFSYSKPEILPEYAVQKLIYFINSNPDMKQDESLKDICNYLIESNLNYFSSSLALRGTLSRDIISANSNQEQLSAPLLKDSIGLERLEKSTKMVELWQILQELGHYTSFNYNHIANIFKEYQDLKEPQLAKTLLMLSINQSGFDDQNSKIALAIYEANKKGEKISDKEILEKKNQPVSWNLENLGRILRECFSNLTWEKVFEGLALIQEDLNIDQKAISFFYSLFNRVKPQNLQFPLYIILDREWANPLNQIQFIEHSINLFIDKKEKQIGFNRLTERQEVMEDLTGMKEKQPEIIQVWSSIQLVHRLVHLSHSHHFQKVRCLFEFPIKNCPEYLLLALSKAKSLQGNLMIDELLSLLLPQFLGNHINSIPVLQQLWKNNQSLMIRGICELCRHDQRIMNLSRVLDITQEVKESLLPIVECEDYFFAVNLGILAGKRDFLHYDVWLSRRIQTIGTPFIRALLKYIKDHIIHPIQEQKKLINQEDEQFESFKNQVLDRSHLSKEKLVITLEHLQQTINANNPNVKKESIEQIREIIVKTTQLFPNFTMQNQSSEEIDNEANNYFQRVFSAEPELVDNKILELIETMHKFKQSPVKKEQEVYACMLHSLFDEYRFLHRYPPPYLDKIAKVFGAIIKHKIIEGTLQEIALKFVIEALRREGKRQRFGIITMKQFIDMLPQFPQFFKEIYDIKATIQKNEPQMAIEIERLWEKVKNDQEREAKQAEEPPKPEDKKTQKQQQDPTKQEEKSIRKAQDKMDQSRMPQFNDKEFQSNLQSISQSQGENQRSSQRQLQTQLNEGSLPFTPQVIRQAAPVQAPNPVNEQSSLSRIPGRLQNESQPFIPSGRAISQASSQQPPPPTQLNIQSEAFKLPAANTPLSQPQARNSPAPSSSSNFNPNAQNFKPQPRVTQVPNLTPELIKMKQIIDDRIAKAKSENKIIRLDDVIEDDQANAPSTEVQENMRIIINNTGRSNFQVKLQELKELMSTGGLYYLNWFVGQILVKRLIGQLQPTLQNIYVEIIKQIGMIESVNLTVQKSIELFKRCLLINEDDFQRVTRINPAAPNPIKAYLSNLGSFVGQLTLMQNRPLYTKELNVKQLIVEAYDSDKLRLVLTFVCRIIKESKQSSIFKPNNPWLSGILSLLKEIFEHPEQEKFRQDIYQEIESTFIHLQANLRDFPASNILKSIQSQQFSQLLSPQQQFELSYILEKVKTEPQYPCIGQPVKKEETKSVQEPIQTQLNQQQQIFERVVIQNETLQKIKALFNFNDQKVKQLVGEAVDSSIVEILPPVVDRSVTIALITTRELVIKDFAFDGDHNRILRAADALVQHLAGSLALVTCREPLKMSLTTNLKKQLTSLSIQQRLPNQQEQVDTLIQEIATSISKENLELGCTLIKEAVISRALNKVREDTTLAQAVEKRKQFSSNGDNNFRDETVVSYFTDLPQQLKPNPSGLTESQFQVYEDFANLIQAPKQQNEQPIQLGASPIPETQPMIPATKQAANADRIDQIFTQIMSQAVPVNDQIKKLIHERVIAINNDKQQAEKDQLIVHIQKWIILMCNKFKEKKLNEFELLLVLIQLILVNCNFPEAYKKTTQEFFNNEKEMYKIGELNIILLKNGILLPQEWDFQMASMVVKNTDQKTQDYSHYFAELCNEIINHQILSVDQIQHTLTALQLQRTGSFKELFIKWVQISLKEPGPGQKEEINKFFQELEERGLYKSEEHFYKFLKVMIQTSVEKALYNQKGELRPNEKIDYRYIESFFKLVVVLLRTSDFNKHEFMGKVFEAIYEVLEEDHRTNKARFNQKPYYRILLNILQAININQFFNSKAAYLVQLTQSLILPDIIIISLCELFNKLSPLKCPGFSFAWLELISHKSFMPLFLKSPPMQPAHPSQLQANITQEHSALQKKQVFKELIVQLFTFLNNIMAPGLEVQSVSLKKFYEGTIRVALVIFKDYPDFFAEYHFNFVACLPDHLIQLRNIILSSYPANIQPPNPFNKTLKVDLLVEMKETPKILSNFENYLHIQNLKEDLESYFRTKNPWVIDTICRKLAESEVVEQLNQRKKKNPKVIGAVVLFVAAHVSNTNAQKPLTQKESMDMFKQIILKLDENTRLVLLNSIVNELRYPNSHTYYFSCVILYLFAEQLNTQIQEQIARIFIERLQANRPHPWGLMISFRELIQNPKYGFMKKPFITQNQAAINKLFEDRLKNYQNFNTASKQTQQKD